MSTHRMMDCNNEVSTLLATPHSMFLKLPNEMISHIFTQVKPVDIADGLFTRYGSDNLVRHFRKQKRLLAAICRTCKLFNLLATPHLYNSFLVGDNREFYAPSGKTLRGATPLRLFLRSIISRPALAKLVKVLGIEQWHVRRDWLRHLCPQPKDEKLEDGVHDLYASTLIKYSPDVNGKDWSSDLLSGNMEAEAALVLCLLEDVHELSIHFADHSGGEDDKYSYLLSSFLCASRGAVSGVAHSFSKLTHLSLRSVDTWELDDPLTIHLPEVADLPIFVPIQVLNLSGAFDFWSGTKEDFTIAGLNTLKLEYCRMSMSTLSALFKSCPKLEHLDIQFTNTPIVGTWPSQLTHRHPIAWASVVRALEPLHDRIRTLRLSRTSDPFQSDNLDWKDLRRDTIGSMHHFIALRHLAIPHKAYPGQALGDGLPIIEGRPPLAVILPANLEILTVTDCSQKVISHFDTLATCLQSGESHTMPTSLSQIVLESQPYCFDLDEHKGNKRMLLQHRVNRICNVFRLKGIDLVIDEVLWLPVNDTLGFEDESSGDEETTRYEGPNVEDHS